MSPDDARGALAGRGSSRRLYLLALFLIIGLPLIGSGAVWWLTASKRAVERAFTEPARELRGHGWAVHSLALSPDGRRVLSGSGDGTLRLWDYAACRPLLLMKGHRGPVLAVAFSPDGRRALSGSGDWSVRLWDLEPGERIRTLSGHE